MSYMRSGAILRGDLASGKITKSNPDYTTKGALVALSQKLINLMDSLGQVNSADRPPSTFFNGPPTLTPSSRIENNKVLFICPVEEGFYRDQMPLNSNYI